MATSISENKDLVSRVVRQVISDGDFDVARELFADDFAQYGGVSGDLEGVDALQEWMETVYAGFSDFSATEEFSMGEGDLVASHITYAGTHDGEFMGIPATGEPVEITGTTIFRIVDGKLTESWVETDTLGILQQVGAVDAPAN